MKIQTFQYDPLNCLINASDVSGTTNKYGQTFQYDKIGDIQQVKNLQSGETVWKDDFEELSLTPTWDAAVQGGTKSPDLWTVSAPAFTPVLGNQSLLVEVNDATDTYVQHNLSSGQSEVRVRFYFHPNNIAMANGDSLTLFTGNNSSGTAVVKVALQYSNGVYQVQASAMDNSSNWQSGNWYTIGNQWNALELDLQSAANSGSLGFWVNGAFKQTISGINNSNQLVSQERLGAMSVNLTNVGQSSYDQILYDAFESRTLTYIGLLPTPQVTDAGSSSNHLAAYHPAAGSNQISDTVLQDVSTPTAISACGAYLSPGALTNPGNTMSMTATNVTGVPLAIQAIYVYWNNTTGHSGGSDNTLDLLSISIGSTTSWSTTAVGSNPHGDPGVYAPFYSVPLTSASLPIGTSTVAFTFTQSYTNPNGTERIYIMFSTNGCQGDVIDSSDGGIDFSTPSLTPTFTIVPSPTATVTAGPSPIATLTPSLTATPSKTSTAVTNTVTPTLTSTPVPPTSTSTNTAPPPMAAYWSFDQSTPGFDTSGRSTPSNGTPMGAQISARLLCSFPAVQWRGPVFQRAAHDKSGTDQWFYALHVGLSKADQFRHFVCAPEQRRHIAGLPPLYQFERLSDFPHSKPGGYQCHPHSDPDSSGHYCRYCRSAASHKYLDTHRSGL